MLSGNRKDADDVTAHFRTLCRLWRRCNTASPSASAKTFSVCRRGSRRGDASSAQNGTAHCRNAQITTFSQSIFQPFYPSTPSGRGWTPPGLISNTTFGRVWRLYHRRHPLLGTGCSLNTVNYQQNATGGKHVYVLYCTVVCKWSDLVWELSKIEEL